MITSIHIYLNIYLCTHVYTYIHIYIYVYTRIYTYIFTYIYLCVYKDYESCDQGKMFGLNWLCVFVYICVNMKIFV